MDSDDLAESPMRGFCEHGNELSGSGKECPDPLNTYQLLKMGSVP
jgi:hypothetical protein